MLPACVCVRAMSSTRRRVYLCVCKSFPIKSFATSRRRRSRSRWAQATLAAAFSAAAGCSSELAKARRGTSRGGKGERQQVKGRQLCRIMSCKLSWSAGREGRRQGNGAGLNKYARSFSWKWRPSDEDTCRLSVFVAVPGCCCCCCC